jgi:hypothetical protein
MQGWIKRRGCHLQQILRCRQDRIDDCMPMLGADEKSPQNRRIERSMEEAGLPIHVVVILLNI